MPMNRDGRERVGDNASEARLGECEDRIRTNWGANPSKRAHLLVLQIALPYLYFCRGYVDIRNKTEDRPGKHARASMTSLTNKVLLGFHRYRNRYREPECHPSK